MLCEKCHEKPATIHITETIRAAAGQDPATPVMHHYCESCGRPVVQTGHLVKEASLSGPTPPTELLREAASTVPPPGPQIDVSRRYDVYCIEPTRDVVVYRNALFKRASVLLPGSGAGGRIVHHDFIELEQNNERSVFISRSSIFRLCEPGTPIVAEIVTRDKPVVG